MSRRTRDAHCRVDLTHWSRYDEGELSAAECRRCEAHLATCATCRAMLSGLRRLLRSCRRAGQVAPPPEVRARARREARRLVREA